ncbi:MAG: hypothetical protein A2104_00320 [Candidatus Melainabacteria bacterium GWF2_32_7]|nr:MAG: hypothetical protein A2104_00320 [Candidatus Melainabacteria bacterium GWF2_32_7]
MPDLVCFIGCMGSGKDYQSRLLIENGFKLINIGDSLREMAWDILGWKPNNDEEYEEFKKKNLISCEGLIHQELSGRQFLQNLGTQAIRKRFPDFWIELWKNKVSEELSRGSNVVCSDIRFLKEVEVAINILSNAKIIFCNYKSERYNCTDKHESEQLAQKVLSDGFNDLDLVSHQYIKALL